MAYTFKQNLVAKSKYSIKCPYEMKAEYIVVHNTANDASAENEVKYMINNNNQVSYHVAIDDKEVIQAIPYDRNAWHSGDGANGNGNRKGIGVEICYSKSGGSKFDEAEKNASVFIAKMLKDRNWGIDRVKRHYDFSKKQCPHRTMSLGWDRFLKLVQSELDKLNKPKTSTNSSVVYQVIVGSYADKNNANKIKSKLESQGYKGVWLNATKKDGKTYYQVICGSYGIKKNAEDIKAKLDKAYKGVWINTKK